MDTFDFVQTIYLSRKTLLDILEERGYLVEPFRKFSPLEISAALTQNNFSSLGFTVQKKDDAIRPNKCLVEYSKLGRSKIATICEKLEDADVANTEMIVMINESTTEVHDNISISEYNKRKARVSFFYMYAITVNPLKHSLVPKHEIISNEDYEILSEKYHLSSRKKLPMIKYHKDPITKCIGAVPDNIIKITRPSPTSGEYIIYRVVVV